MRKLILYLLVIVPGMAVGQGSGAILVDNQPMCWVISGVDSSITRFVQLSDRTPDNPSILSYMDAEGNAVTVAGGRLFYGYCSECVRDTLPIPRIEDFNVAQPVQNPFNPTQCNSQVTALVYGVTDSATQISITVDGSPITFMFFPETNELISEIIEDTTGSGTHTVVLTVTIPSGTTMDSDTFDCGT